MANSKVKVQALRTGDLVDIVAPGFAPSETELEFGVRFLEGQGFRTRIQKGLIGGDRICAAPDQTRFEHLEKAITCRESRLVWCVRGGYGSLRLIPFLERSKKLAQLARNAKRRSSAKAVFGFSDISSIQLWLLQRLNWVSFHGPVLERLGRALIVQDQLDPKKLPPSPAELEEIFRILRGEQTELSFEGLRWMNQPKRIMQSRSSLNNKSREMSVQGRITGGNLETFASHIGTSLHPKTQNAIVVFEDWGERGYRIDRRLEQLVQSKALNEKTRAILFGDFLGGDEPDGTNKVWDAIERFAKSWAEPRGIPVLSGMPFGHGVRQRVIPYGGSAKLDLSSLSVSVQTGVEAGHLDRR